MSTHLKSAENFLERIMWPGSRFFKTVSAVILAIMPLPVFFDVIYRLTFRGSIPGVIEMEEFMMVFVVYFALAFTQIDDGHIRIDLLLSKMPKEAP